MGELQLLFKQLQALKTNNRRSAKTNVKSMVERRNRKINMN